MEEKNFYKSKKFWTLISTIALITINKKFDLGLDDETVKYLALVSSSYLFGQGIADMGLLKGVSKQPNV